MKFRRQPGHFLLVHQPERDVQVGQHAKTSQQTEHFPLALQEKITGVVRLQHRIVPVGGAQIASIWQPQKIMLHRKLATGANRLQLGARGADRLPFGQHGAGHPVKTSSDVRLADRTRQSGKLEWQKRQPEKAGQNEA